MTQQRRLRIGVLEDQPLFRDMLHHLLLAIPGARVSAAADCTQALAQWDARDLDVAVLDIDLPDGSGLDVGRDLQRENPDIGIVLLSAVDRSDALLELDDRERERWSYLSKQSSTSAASLIRAVRESAAGRCVIDPAVVAARRPRAGGRVASLSTRQQQVLALLAEGLSNQSIADRLGIALTSTANHLNSIYSALGIDRTEFNPRVAAVRVFLQETA